MKGENGISDHSTPPSRDWGHYGLTLAVGGLLALLIFAEGRVLSAQQEAEAEETRRYIAEAIAMANERAAVNSIRIDYLEEESAKPSPDSPPAN